MKRVVLGTLLIAFSAHVVAAIPVNDIATSEASGSNFTRNFQGKKEKMVPLTSAFFKYTLGPRITIALG
jgi:hypothetical protein